MLNTIAVSVTADYAIHHAIPDISTLAAVQGFMAASSYGFIVLSVISVVVFCMINSPVLAQKGALMEVLLMIFATASRGYDFFILI